VHDGVIHIVKRGPGLTNFKSIQSLLTWCVRAYEITAGVLGAHSSRNFSLPQPPTPSPSVSDGSNSGSDSSSLHATLDKGEEEGRRGGDGSGVKEACVAMAEKYRAVVSATYDVSTLLADHLKLRQEMQTEWCSHGDASDGDSHEEEALCEYLRYGDSSGGGVLDVSMENRRMLELLRHISIAVLPRFRHFLSLAHTLQSNETTTNRNYRDEGRDSFGDAISLMIERGLYYEFKFHTFLVSALDRASINSEELIDAMETAADKWRHFAESSLIPNLTVMTHSSSATSTTSSGPTSVSMSVGEILTMKEGTQLLGLLATSLCSDVKGRELQALSVFKEAQMQMELALQGTIATSIGYNAM
jgi:hypothetical protein